MKRFKQIDLAGQIALIITFLVVSLIRIDSTFMIGYFVVGAWQAASMLIHFLLRLQFRKGNKRYYYTITSAIVIALMCLVFVPGIIAIYVIMLFAAPIMAVYYCCLCFYELRHFAKRPLELI